MTSLYKVGTTAGNKVALDTLVPRDPQPSFPHYAEYVVLGDQSTRGRGPLQGEWRWKMISLSEIAALRTYFTDVSDEVFVTTPDMDGVWAGYQVLAIWPQIPTPLHGDWLEDFAIQFATMVASGGTT